jgi:hypothetical protein
MPALASLATDEEALAEALAAQDYASAPAQAAPVPPPAATAPPPAAPPPEAYVDYTVGGGQENAGNGTYAAPVPEPYATPSTDTYTPPPAPEATPAAPPPTVDPATSPEASRATGYDVAPAAAPVAPPPAAPAPSLGTLTGGWWDPNTPATGVTTQDIADARLFGPDVNVGPLARDVPWTTGPGEPGGWIRPLWQSLGRSLQTGSTLPPRPGETPGTEDTSAQESWDSMSASNVTVPPPYAVRPPAPVGAPPESLVNQGVDASLAGQVDTRGAPVESWTGHALSGTLAQPWAGVVPPLPYTPSYLSGSDTPSGFTRPFNQSDPVQAITRMGLDPTIWPELAQQDSFISFRPAPAPGPPPPSNYEVASGRYLAPRRNTGGKGSGTIPEWQPGNVASVESDLEQMLAHPQERILGGLARRLGLQPQVSPDDPDYANQLVRQLAESQTSMLGTAIHNTPQEIGNLLGILGGAGKQSLEETARGLGLVGQGLAKGADIVSQINAARPSGGLATASDAITNALMSGIENDAAMREEAWKTIEDWAGPLGQYPREWQSGILSSPIANVARRAGTTADQALQDWAANVRQKYGTDPLAGVPGALNTPLPGPQTKPPPPLQAGNWAGNKIRDAMEAWLAGQPVPPPTEQDVIDTATQAKDATLQNYAPIVNMVQAAMQQQEQAPAAAAPVPAPPGGQTPPPPLINYRDTTVRYSPEASATMPRLSRMVPPEAMPEGAPIDRTLPVRTPEPSARGATAAPTPPLGDIGAGRPPQDPLAGARQVGTAVLQGLTALAAQGDRPITDFLPSAVGGTAQDWARQFQQNSGDNRVFGLTREDLDTARANAVRAAQDFVPVPNVSLPDLQGPKDWGARPNVSLPDLQGPLPWGERLAPAGGTAQDWVRQFQQNSGDNRVFGLTRDDLDAARAAAVQAVGSPEQVINQIGQASQDNVIFPGLGGGFDYTGLLNEVRNRQRDYATGVTAAQSAALPAGATTKDADDASGASFILDANGNYIGIMEADGTTPRIFPTGMSASDRNAEVRRIKDEIAARGPQPSAAPSAAAPGAPPSAETPPAQSPAPSPTSSIPSEPSPQATTPIAPLATSSPIAGEPSTTPAPTTKASKDTGTSPAPSQGGKSSGHYDENRNWVWENDSSSGRSSGTSYRSGSSYSRTKKKKKSSSSGSQFWPGFPFNRPASPLRQQILDAIAASQAKGKASKSGR